MGDDERTGAEILVNATLAAIRPTPLQFVRPLVLPSFSLPPVEQDLDLFVRREISHQIVAEVRLVSRNDQQVSSRLHFVRPFSGRHWGIRCPC